MTVVEDIPIQSQIFISYHLYPLVPQILNQTIKQEVQCDTRKGRSKTWYPCDIFGQKNKETLEEID